jgi:hypothetical protein
MRSRGPWILFLVGAILALLIGAKPLIDDATRDRQIILASPAAPGVFAHPEISLRRGAVACIGPVTFRPDVKQVAVIVVGKSDPPSVIRITAHAGGRSQGGLAGTANGLATTVAAPVSFDRAQSGQVCVSNPSRRPVGLIGTTEPIYVGAVRTTVDGKPQPVSATLLLLGRPSSLLGRIDDAVRADTMLTGVLPPALGWLLLALVLVGIPVAILKAVAGTFRDE